MKIRKLVLAVVLAAGTAFISSSCGGGALAGFKLWCEMEDFYLFSGFLPVPPIGSVVIGPAGGLNPYSIYSFDRSAYYITNDSIPAFLDFEHGLEIHRDYGDEGIYQIYGLQYERSVFNAQVPFVSGGMYMNNTIQTPALSGPSPTITSWSFTQVGSGKRALMCVNLNGTSMYRALVAAYQYSNKPRHIRRHMDAPPGILTCGAGEEAYYADFPNPTDARGYSGVLHAGFSWDPGAGIDGAVNIVRPYTNTYGVSVDKIVVGTNFFPLSLNLGQTVFSQATTECYDPDEICKTTLTGGTLASGNSIAFDFGGKGVFYPRVTLDFWSGSTLLNPPTGTKFKGLDFEIHDSGRNPVSGATVWLMRGSYSYSCTTDAAGKCPMDNVAVDNALDGELYWGTISKTGFPDKDVASIVEYSTLRQIIRFTF
ncbi:MAG: hypothetical protein ACREJQ_04370 [bacterium]